jgi:Ca2+-binding EF-hand superfamily protein
MPLRNRDPYRIPIFLHISATFCESLGLSLHSVTAKVWPKTPIIYNIMKYKWIITAVTVGLISALSLQAEDKKKAKGPGNGPGKGRPGSEEMRKKMLEKFDKDGDGKLNEAERAEAKKAMQKRGAEMFSKADANGDGKISKDEVPEQAWARISKADKDGDGGVTKEEMAALRAAGGGRGGPGGKGKPGARGEGAKGDPIAQFDKNKDGKLGKDEVPAEIWARMSKADKNADGLISKGELESAHKGRPGAGGEKKKKKPGDS